MNTMLHRNIGTNKSGHLTFAKVDTTALAKKYGTPLMLVDEEGIRQQCRLYIEATRKHFGPNSRVLYASKAFCFTALYKILREEGLGADVISLGEMHTAVTGGMPLSETVFHGNFKQDEELHYAISNKIGRIVIDSLDDLERIIANIPLWNEGVARSDGVVRQKVQLRIIPGVEPDTHSKIITGNKDTKFGVPMRADIVKRIIDSPHLELTGFHYHIGSQIFETMPFIAAVSNLMNFVAHLKDTLGFETKEINIGGGAAVRYTESQPIVDYKEIIANVANVLKATTTQLPAVWLEPGRSIIAQNCMTLYTVGAVKNNYIIVDGGMTDNPRYALYGAPYTIYNAKNPTPSAPSAATPSHEGDYYTVAGRCCESGDIIQENVNLPKTVAGDILAVACTGAYNYSMASNYNRLPRPAVVMIDKNGKDRIVIRRETVEDLLHLDILPRP